MGNSLISYDAVVDEETMEKLCQICLYRLKDVSLLCRFSGFVNCRMWYDKHTKTNFCRHCPPLVNIYVPWLSLPDAALHLDKVDSERNIWRLWQFAYMSYRMENFSDEEINRGMMDDRVRMLEMFSGYINQDALAMYEYYTYADYTSRLRRNPFSHGGVAVQMITKDDKPVLGVRVPRSFAHDYQSAGAVGEGRSHPDVLDGALVTSKPNEAAEVDGHLDEYATNKSKPLRDLIHGSPDDFDEEEAAEHSKSAVVGRSPSRMAASRQSVAASSARQSSPASCKTKTPTLVLVPGDNDGTDQPTFRARTYCRFKKDEFPHFFLTEGENEDAGEVPEFHWDNKRGKWFQPFHHRALSMIMTLGNSQYRKMLTIRKVAASVTTTSEKVCVLRGGDCPYKPLVKLANRVQDKLEKFSKLLENILCYKDENDPKYLNGMHTIIEEFEECFQRVGCEMCPDITMVKVSPYSLVKPWKDNCNHARYHLHVRLSVLAPWAPSYPC